MASSSPSYRWPWINSEPQNKAQRHEHEKGLVGRREGSLKTGKNSERSRDESNQNALYSWMKWTKKHLINNKFIYLALIDWLKFHSVPNFVLGLEGSEHERNWPLSWEGCMCTLVWRTHVLQLASHTLLHSGSISCVVCCPWLFREPLFLQLKASPLCQTTLSSCRPLLDTGVFSTTFPILRSSSDKNLNHGNLWLVTLRWLCLGTERYLVG